MLAYIQAGKGRQGIGLTLECRKGARLDAEERLERVREAIRARGIVLGSTPADLSGTAAVDAAVSELLGRLKPGMKSSAAPSPNDRSLSSQSANVSSVQTPPRALESIAAVMNLTPLAPSSTVGTKVAPGSGRGSRAWP